MYILKGDWLYTDYRQREMSKNHYKPPNDTYHGLDTFEIVEHVRKRRKGTATVSWWQYSWINGAFLLQHFLDHFRDLYNSSIPNVTDVQSQCSCSWSQWNTSSDGFPKTQTLQHIQKDMLKVVAFCLDLTSHPPAFWAHPFVAGQTPCISGTKPYPLAHLPMAGQPQQGLCILQILGLHSTAQDLELFMLEQGSWSPLFG